MKIEIDASEVLQLAKDVRKAAHEMRGGVYGIVAKAGVNMKSGMIKNLRSSQGRPTSLPWLIPAISYDIWGREGTWTVEAGPDKSISGLGLGREIGSVHHAPMPFANPAFVAELPKMEAAVVALQRRTFG